VAAVDFAVDTMPGRLARWLRILGHDVAYGPHLHGRGLVACARRERRMIVTRDTRLVRDPELPPHVFVTSDHFREQLREVAAAVPLAADAAFTRCVECNRPLADVARDAVRERVRPTCSRRSTASGAVRPAIASIGRRPITRACAGWPRSARRVAGGAHERRSRRSDRRCAPCGRDVLAHLWLDDVDEGAVRLRPL
jgi:uncharacterized protein with PIN domain